MVRIRAFINARVCAYGKETLQDFHVDLDTGCIVDEPCEMAFSVVDMHNRLIAPAFQELQINGCLGVHFSTFMDTQSYLSHLEKVSRHLVTQGRKTCPRFVFVSTLRRWRRQCLLRDASYRQ